jgi:hypothetical protein
MSKKYALCPASRLINSPDGGGMSTRRHDERLKNAFGSG